jgi:predicted nucleotidyltransferase
MTKLEQIIIKLLSNYPEQEFYCQEIARKANCSKASVSGILKSLHNKKLVFKNVKGHMKFYQIDQKNSEIKKFKIIAAIERLNPLLPKMKKFSQKIILFGSASRGEQTIESDIDLFILSKDKNGARLFLKKINPDLNIKTIIKTPGEWSEMEVKEPVFYQEIKNGITLYNYVPRI